MVMDHDLDHDEMMMNNQSSRPHGRARAPKPNSLTDDLTDQGLTHDPFPTGLEQKVYYLVRALEMTEIHLRDMVQNIPCHT